MNINDADAYPFTKAFSHCQVPLAPVHLVERPVSAAARAADLASGDSDDPT